MRFNQWLRLHENPHATVDSPIRWQGKDIIILDLRAEDWKIIEGKPNTLQTQSLKNKLSMYQFNGYPPFIGRIPGDGRFLFHDGNDSFNFNIVDTPSGSNATNLDQLAIEGNWWDYVIGYDHKDNRVKQPKFVRTAEVPTMIGSNSAF